MAKPIGILALLLLPLAGQATLKFDLPSGWTSHPPSSTMRVAEIVLPKEPADTEDATLTLYYFGGAGGGTVQANIDRWIGQMAQPEGKPSQAAATTSAMTVHGLQVALVDVTGTYTAEMSPGSADHYNKPGFRLRAGVVTTPGGSYYIKLVGPAKTVAKWDSAFDAFLKSLRYE